MISSVHGRVVHIDTDLLVVEVGGVGLSVSVTPQLSAAAHLGDQLRLHTTLIVREDALSLFGFDTRDELGVFTQLLGVTGVGPRSALGILSTLTVGQIAAAVTADDDAPFRRVSGIGPKTAKLIVVQLAGKLAPSLATAHTQPDAAPGVSAQVTQALVGLGWSERTAAEAVASVTDDASETDRASVQALPRLTLAMLGPARRETAGG